MIGAYKESRLLSTAPQGHIVRAKSRTMPSTYQVSMDVRVGATGGSIDLKTPKARVQGGLYVGTLVGQTGSFNLGDIWAGGLVSSAGGLAVLGATRVTFQTERASGYAKGLRWKVGPTGTLAVFTAESLPAGVNVGFNVYAATWSRQLPGNDQCGAD